MRGEQYLTKSAQYGLVYEKGGSWANKMVVMKAMPNGLEISRYGFSVSRRVGGAVVRNRVKRRLRELLRRFPLKPGWDMIFIVRVAASSASYDYLGRATESLLARAGLLGSKDEESSPRPD